MLYYGVYFVALLTHRKLMKALGTNDNIIFVTMTLLDMAFLLFKGKNIKNHIWLLSKSLFLCLS